MTHAILTTVSERPGMLYAITKVLADHAADIKYVDIHGGESQSEIYFEFTLEGDDLEVVLRDLRACRASRAPRKRQLSAASTASGSSSWAAAPRSAMVAMGAIAEADRHNIRGERISVDTIPLVGEQELAAAVRATARLPRVRMLVLAGSHHGRRDQRAVEEVRRNGLP